MKNKIVVMVGLCLSLLLLYSCVKTVVPPIQHTFKLHFPSFFPEPTYDFSNNPFSTEKFELGKKFFHDTRLSRNNTISCATCHIQSAGFTHHGHDVSHGIDDRLGRRNSMPIMNLAWNKAYMWDGGIFNLDFQPIVPITAHEEMDETIENVIEKLNRDPNLKALNKSAFDADTIQANHLYKALSIYMLSLVSANAKFDSVVYNQNATFTQLEQQGYEIFQRACQNCHTPPLFTSLAYKRNGLKRYNNDLGRMEVTLDPADSFAFRIPSLRNLSYTAPYMHDGRFLNIDGVLDHYQFLRINHQDADTGLYQNNQWGIVLTNEERQALKAFLKTLDDVSFIKNKHFSNE